MKRWMSLVLVFALAAAMSGCGSSSDSTQPSTDAAGAQSEVDAGNAALAGGDYTAANTHFKSAIAKDPSNSQAQFGAAVTEVFLIQDDPDIQALAGQFNLLRSGPTPVGHTRTARRAALAQRIEQSRAQVGGGYTPDAMGRATFRMFGMAASDPQSLSDIQAIVRNKVMPKLQYAEDRLNAAEANPNFQLLLPPAVTDLPDTLEIDNTEAYILDSVINGVQGWLGLLVAYNFDVENTDYDNVNAESLLTPGTAWAALHPGGALQLAAAKANFLALKTRFDQASTYLANETDDQANDLIPQDWIGTQEFTDLQYGIGQVYLALTGPVTITVTDKDGLDFDLQLNIGKVFVPAIDDLKTKLPNHTFPDGVPDIDYPLVFPDPEINGIFPGMTNARWQQLDNRSAPPPPTKALALRAGRTRPAR